MKCIEKDCHRKADPFLCSFHGREATLAHDDWNRLEKLQARRYVVERPSQTSPNDWREGTFNRSALQRHYRLFPSETYTAKKIAVIPKTGTWREPLVGWNEHGLWPIEYILALVELKSDIEHLLRSRLTLREEIVIRMRFGIPGVVERCGETIEIDTYDMTLDEIAEKLRVSRERVRQIEQQALSRLRHPIASKMLKPHYGERGRFFKRRPGVL